MHDVMMGIKTYSLTDRKMAYNFLHNFTLYIFYKVTAAQNVIVFFNT